MKVALCFWGICRSTDLTIESIQKNIFNILKENNIEYDIYLHTFTLYRPYVNPRAGEFSLQLKNTIWKLLEPTFYCVESQDLIDRKLQPEKYRSCGNPWPDIPTFNTLDNHIRSLYSLKKVTEMWEPKSSDYTAVIYLRPDVRFTGPFNINWLKNIKPNCIFMPNFHLIDKCNDRFAVGSPETMKLYGTRFDSAYEYSLTRCLHSEKYLAHILQKHNIQIEHIPFFFRRIRADGSICDGDTNL